MPRQIILNGTVANDGTGDNLRVTADKINANFSELYGWLRVDNNGNLKLVNTEGELTIGAGAGGLNSPAITIPENINSAIKIGTTTNPINIGNPNDPVIRIPSNPSEPVQIGKSGQPIQFVTGRPSFQVLYTGSDGKLSSDAKFVVNGVTLDVTIDSNLTINGLQPNKFVKTNADKKLISDDVNWNEVALAPCASNITIGHDCPGGKILIPAPGSGTSITITNPIGAVEIGTPNAGPIINVPNSGGVAPIIINNPSGPIQVGSPGAPGISIPTPGSNDPIKIGNQNSPAIVIPSNPNQPVQVGKPGQPVDVVTGLNKWELIYTGDDGKLDSSPFLKVTQDNKDTEGKSLHLHTSLYTSGLNSKLQSTIYFVDDVAAPNRGQYSAETTDSKRAASMRFVKQSFGQGLIFSPWANYNDTAFHDKGGIAVWRTTYGNNSGTKVTLNDDAVGPSIHGLYLGSGAISFFQDLAGGNTPNTNGLTYIVLPGIPDGSGVNKVGQIFANPYRNSGNPYFGLGWKQSTQLPESGGGFAGIEAAERVPGNEIITWHTTNRVGIMNNNPNWTLSVTGDVAFTKTLRVGTEEDAGVSGAVLISKGANTNPIWSTSISVPANANDPLKLGGDSPIPITVPRGNSKDSLTIGNPGTGAPPAGGGGSGGANGGTPAQGNAGGQPGISIPTPWDSRTTPINPETPATLKNPDGPIEIGNPGAPTGHGIKIPTPGSSDAMTIDTGLTANRVVWTKPDKGTLGVDDKFKYDGTTAELNAQFKTKYVEFLATPTVSGSFAPDWKLGTVQTITLDNNLTLNEPVDLPVGGTMTIIIKQDGTGSRTISYQSGKFIFAAGIKTLTTTPNAVDMLNIFNTGVIGPTQYMCALTTDYKA